MYSLLVACGASGVRISFDTKPKASTFSIELATTAARQEQGLMNRKMLAKGSGMLFIFSDEQNRSFWMKNTLIPLDIIFMNSKKKIVGIIRNAKPQSLELLSVAAPSQYVLEVNAGEADQAGLNVNHQASF